MASLASAPPPRPQSHEDYTVGWICALDLELTAALAMLDDWHEDDPPNFEKPAADENFYHFGRIGKHNVVITCLEAGTTGPVAAAAAAKSMVFTFPNIKFGLLVGIGGAASQTNSEGEPIRLGDVAISQPTGTNGGVFQHDLRKAYPGGQTQSKSFLNKPPGVLLNALNGMRARLKLRPSKVPQFLDELPSKLRKQKDKLAYTHQGIHQDRLFDAKYPHLDGTDCSECESVGEVPRQDRDSKDPEFHYGIIASGGTVCKDAELRDQIKDQVAGCICIEMEAAGLMNSFPCLVIRGISDYSDSHKNDIWQPYAAATAAAYAKELLGYVQPQAVAGAKKASLLMKLNEYMENLSDRIISGFRQQENRLSDKEIERWLSPPNPSSNYVEAIEKRHPHTGSWFLESDYLLRWMETGSSFLWLHGLPGCGKTVLSSALIEKLKQEWDDQSNKAIIYFYFDFKIKEKQMLDNMARSLVYQLFKLGPHKSEALHHLFAECNAGWEQPTRSRLLGVFDCLLRKFDDVKIVIDAVEEVDQKDKEALLDWIKTLHKKRITGLHLFVSSRSGELDIQRKIGSFDTSVSVPEDAVFQDVKTFVAGKIQSATGSGLARWKNHPKLGEILVQLPKNVKGMFRLASLRLEVIEQCEYNQLEDALAALPQDIYAAYSRILNRIPAIRRRNALKLLQFLAFSSRQFSLNEVHELLAVDLSNSAKLEANTNPADPQDIIRFLPGLVAISEANENLPVAEPKASSANCVQLTHFTVKEYLRSDHVESSFKEELTETHANATIVRTSIAYLKYLSLAPYLSTESLSQDTIFHLCSWLESGKIAEKDHVARDEIFRFLNDPSALEFWLRLHHAPDNKIQPKRSRSELPTPLYIAVRGDMIRVAEKILVPEKSQVNDDVAVWKEKLQVSTTYSPFGFYRRGKDTQQHWRQSALYAAAEQNSSDMVSLLLESGAEIGIHGGELGTALFVAVQRSCTDALKEISKHLCALDQNARKQALNGPLLKEHIDQAFSNVQRGFMLSMNLECELAKQFAFAAEMQRDYGDTNLSSNILGSCRNEKTARSLFHVVASAGSPQLVKSLIDIGADINAPDNMGMTPLHSAVAEGPTFKRKSRKARGIRNEPFYQIGVPANSLETVRILLLNGGDMDRKDSRGLTPLHSAVLRGTIDFASLLVAETIKISSQKPIGARQNSQVSLISGSSNVSAHLSRHGITKPPRPPERTDLIRIDELLARIHQRGEFSKLSHGNEYDDEDSDDW